MYTDGLTEAFNPDGEEFGEERLVDALQQRSELPPKDLLKSLVEDIRQFSPDQQHDDITLVVARCTGD
jgi:sigma-B regulation protein RsbU (phosphoserine phosphatase)